MIYVSSPNEMGSIKSISSFFALQELIPTSNINAVVSLTRLFEVLLCSVLENEPTTKHTRVWTMVCFMFKVVLN